MMFQTHHMPALTPFNEEQYLEINIWVLGMLITTGISLLLDS